MTADSTSEWRYYPTTTLLPGSGCYAFQVDGTGFSDVIVFQTSTASQ